MFELQGAGPLAGADETQRNVRVDGIDYESLLVNWLNELLFLQEQYREVYERFEISQLSPTGLVAQVFGKPRGKMDKIIKAATFHNLKIVQTKDSWQATVVVDV